MTPDVYFLEPKCSQYLIEHMHLSIVMATSLNTPDIMSYNIESVVRGNHVYKIDVYGQHLLENL